MKVAAELDNLYVVLEAIGSFAQEHGVNAEKIGQIELTIEEILVNIINYAYPDTSGNIEIHYNLPKDQKFVIEVIDWGIPFDPLSFPAPDIHLGAEDRKVGGLGIFLMRKMMDEIHYRREDDKNILTLIMYLSSGKEGL